jgi:hypothetical protein
MFDNDLAIILANIRFNKIKGMLIEPSVVLKQIL